ncbi:NACHT domain-containing protein [Nonomuraea sp. NPDC001684]
MGLHFSQVGLEKADQASSVIGAFIGVIGLGLTARGMWAERVARLPLAAGTPEENLAAAKRTLAVIVAQQWETEASIRALGDPEPIPISWHLTDDPRLMDHLRLIGPEPLTFTASSDCVRQLAEDFRKLYRRRLVITGGPGTGKTTLAIQLLHELAGPDRRDDDPVPVLVPVNDWDAATYPRLHDWLSTRLSRDYPALRAQRFGPGAAKALVDHGHVLPILDGLDEIPVQARAQVIGTLNRWLAKGDAFILTSRTEEFATAIDQAGDVLTAAAVITPASITAAAAETYLYTCLPPVPRHDWDPVWAALRDGSHPGLSRLTETALGLWLIRTVYITPAADPAPLTGPLAEQEATLRRHLFDHLIPAVIDNRPHSLDPADHFRPRTAWNPDHARNYLAYLARLMHEHSTYDLAWWNLAQHTTSPAEQRLVIQRSGVAAGLTLGLAVALLFGFVGGPALDLEPGLEGGLPFGLMLGLIPGLMLGLMGAMDGPKVFTWFTELPGYADLRLTGRTARFTKNVRFQLVFGLLLGQATTWLAGGLAVIDAFGIAGGFAVGLPAGLVFALALGLIEWAERPASLTAAITPLSSWRADRTLTTLRTTIPGLVSALVAGLAGGFAAGPMVGLADGLAAGLAAGLVSGLMLGRRHAWLIYTLAIWRLAHEGHIPRKLMDFLDDAHRLGLLRSVGPIYQFRHATFQDHLAASITEGS